METFNYKNLPKYKELISKQLYIHDSDFKPIRLDNVLDQKDIDHVTGQVENYPEGEVKVQTWGGQGVHDKIILEPHIKEKLTRLMSEAIGEPMILEQTAVARYSTKFNFLVKLFPHYDMKPVDMFIMDLQLKSNQDWGLVVEGEQFNLKDNQALIFSGTNQIHWREGKNLPANTDIIMLFCWFTHTSPKLKKKKHDKMMRARASMIMNETNILSNSVKTQIVNDEIIIRTKANE
jgi:hypothetical protein